MNQRTHAWIAIRAIELLEKEGLVPGFIKLIKPFTQEACIGAWIPDKRDAKLGGSQTQNHVFKIGLYTGSNKSRFIVSKKDLLKRLGQGRLVNDLLDKHDDILDSNWWSQPYKAAPNPGQHLANRAMALGINNIDMLILGDKDVQAMVPGRVDFIDKVLPENRCTAGQVAIFFFMLSHFIADAIMPCHCDERDLSDYEKGLHAELEKHWGTIIGSYFDEKKIQESGHTDEEIISKATEIDKLFDIQFQKTVPDMKKDDIWEEIVILCRASFAVASIIAPPSQYPYKPNPPVIANFSNLFKKDQKGKDLINDLDRVIMHDAVMNVAIIWKNIWLKFKANNN